VRSLTPKLGTRVIAKAFLKRGPSYGVDDYGRSTSLKSWERTEFDGEAWVHGIYVGRRMKSNGRVLHHGGEDGIEYKPIAYFEVWLVAYAENRDILVCLPKDVVLEKADE
jgi:hypothetical protein